MLMVFPVIGSTLLLFYLPTRFLKIPSKGLIRPGPTIGFARKRLEDGRTMGDRFARCGAEGNYFSYIKIRFNAGFAVAGLFP